MEGRILLGWWYLDLGRECDGGQNNGLVQGVWLGFIWQDVKGGRWDVDKDVKIVWYCIGCMVG